MSKVLSSLGDALPDERPLLSLQIVETLVKCPAGYWPVSKTYDEDADAGLLRQNGLFGKKSTHYICLSKSEGVPGYVMDGVMVIGEREAAPAGYGVAGRAGKRRLCTRVSRRQGGAPQPRVTDVIVCSRMRQAPRGFQLAGEINGKMVCYKVGSVSADASPTHKPNEYENVITNITPEANRRLRAAPERPPKLSPLIKELNNLNLSSSPLSPLSSPAAAAAAPHVYEALRPPPRAAAPAPPAAHHQRYLTLAGHSGMDGVPFQLNPRLRGLPSEHMSQLPVIRRRTRFDLDKEYDYSFSVERQASIVSTLAL